MSNKNNSKTRAFETVSKNSKGFKSQKSRQKFVIAIFVVIILILVSMATLAIGQIIDRFPMNSTSPSTTKNGTVFEIPKDAGDVKIGNLLILDKAPGGSFTYPNVNKDDMVNVWAFRNNKQNDAFTTIKVGTTSYFTYGLGGVANSIMLNGTALEKFNELMLDYCKSLNLTSCNSISASGIIVSWGWSDEDTVEKDVAKEGKDFYDHALGMTLTLRDIYSSPITDQSLKEKFTWIYENAHRYGFINRFTTECNCERPDEYTDRVHLRYVGVEHATYIYEHGICLEEYLTLIREHHKSSGDHLVFGANGKTYEVYYVEYSGNPTLIPVPKNSTYTISGDNMNGFIVTVEK
ncbi:MAG: hypothetical protein ACI3XL_06325 [Eubacteriales bacterium]